MPVPVPAGGKGPVLPAWNKLRLAPEELPQHFNGVGNIGILLGEASGGLVDVDLDCPEAIELADQFLPPTPAETGRASSPRSHRWYYAVGAKTAQHHDPTTNEMIVELRSTGLQTLVGPSVHPSGEAYDMLVGEPATVDAAELAAKVAALAAAVVRRRYGDAVPVPDKGPAATFNRPPTAPPASADAERRAAAYLDKIPGAISGQGGHAQTYAAATAIVHGFGLDPDVAFRMLLERYNPRCEPPWTEKELRHKVDDAATKPHERPFLWLLNAERETGIVPASTAAPSNNGVVVPPGADGDDKGEGDGRPPGSPPRTDAGNAERFARRVADKLRYCHAMGRWLRWDGKRWCEDDAGTPMRQAIMTARGIYAEAGRCRDADERSALAKWARTSESRQRLDAMIAIARSSKDLVVRIADLDIDPWALNVLNGTIDLWCGRLRPHRPEDHITKLAPVEFDPEAQCPLFTTFLERIFGGDQELIGFVQRCGGHALTGDTSEQYLWIFFGAGANGKSVYIDTITGLMGEYAGQAPPQLLMVGKRDEHPTEIADLRGKRLVVASETEEGARLKIQLVKKLTGDKVLKGRLMRQDFFEFERTHKLVMVTNNKPRILEITEAVWRRIRQVPFKVVIPEEERDTGLLKRLEAERPGILAWLVRGCIEWQELGLGEPAAVVGATREYRESEDSVGKFLDERCVVDPNGPEQSTMFAPWNRLYQTYSQWAEGAGERALSSRDFGEALAKRGFPSKTERVGGKPAKGRPGIGLLDT